MTTRLVLFTWILQCNAGGLVRSGVQEGIDEAGRRCALEGTLRPRVMIEDEWFGHARIKLEEPSVDHVIATVRSESDGAEAELDLETREGRGAFFTLILPSATGYVHACRLR